MTTDLPFRGARYDLSNAVALEPLKPGDAATLGAAFATIDPWRRLQFSAQRLATFLGDTQGDSARFAIRRGDATAGCVCVEPSWLCGPYLHFLGVLPEHQGQGIGAAVVAWFIEQARLAKHRNAWICVSAFNDDARRFYVAHGFVEAAQLDDLVRDGEAEILLRKQLFT